MDNRIILLDANTANKIAAGEVVEKPASAVKELIENSLDAGARAIEIEIAGGGVKYIRVTDDGVGMSEGDARLSVLRHATSKIKTESDLMSIKTMGFRGEALPSIASVSRFSLLTRPPDAEFAVKVTLVGGEGLDVTKTGAGVGTSVIVEDLFFNIPARRKFLRTESTESRYVSEVVEKLALSRPDVRFSLVSGGRQVLATPGGGELADAIESIFGAKTREELLPVNYEKDGFKITGYAGNPSLLKSSRQWQTMIANGRVITSRFIARALDHAYQSQLPKNGYPFAVVVLELDMEQTDVNVHPQKSEIKFSDEQGVYRAVYRAFSDALARPLRDGTAPIEARTESGALARPAKQETKRAAPSSYQMDIWKQSPFTVREEVTVYGKQAVRDFFAERAALLAEKELPPSSAAPERKADSDETHSIWPLGQIARTYIVAQSADGLYIIDQHAAHERIVFDRLTANKGDMPVQELLLPVYIQLPADEADLALAHSQTFKSLGFDLEAAGPDALKLTAVPADLSADELESFVRQSLVFIAGMKTPDPGEMRSRLVSLASCRAAIKGGQTLNIRQMRELIAQLMDTRHPFTCPHGRPVIIKYSEQELGRMFKRT
ncbi:MAG: DNA mismatch repair endonuclease MutL [Acidaminococcales bacterium]|jgi:DNA mismatch repair protein MutL|nr:DNA mismatch repair endonuclease MutL [Acidaminococcales bacterium]